MFYTNIYEESKLIKNFEGGWPEIKVIARSNIELNYSTGCPAKYNLWGQHHVAVLTSPVSYRLVFNVVNIFLIHKHTKHSANILLSRGGVGAKPHEYASAPPSLAKVSVNAIWINSPTY